jgi:hypothetical protein
LRLRVLACAMPLAAAATAASAARVTDPFKAAFERELGVGRHAIVKRPLPASSADGEPGYRHDYFSVDVKERALAKAGTWTAQHLDAEIPAGTRVAVTRVRYEDDRIELTVRTLDRHEAHVQTFEELETFVEVSPPPGTYTKGASPAPRHPGPLYRREVKTVAGDKVRKRVTLATEAKFHLPWTPRDLAASDVPAVLEVLRPFLEPATEPLRKLDAAAAEDEPLRPADDLEDAEGEPGEDLDRGPEIEPGMGMDDVTDLLGRPSRAVTYRARTRWTYPDCVVIFEDGKVVEVKF